MDDLSNSASVDIVRARPLLGRWTRDRLHSRLGTSERRIRTDLKSSFGGVRLL